MRCGRVGLCITGAITAAIVGCAPLFFYTDTTNMDIPDGSIASWAQDTIDVPAAFTIADVKVGVNIVHPQDSDLDAWVESPHGTVVPLILHEQGQNFTGTIFDDNAAEPVNKGSAPYTGHWKIDSAYAGKSLSDFAGENSQGTWTLHVRDSVSGNTGYISSWSLNFTAS